MAASYDVQGHFDVQTGAAWYRTTTPAVSGKLALPAESQAPYFVKAKVALPVADIETSYADAGIQFESARTVLVAHLQISFNVILWTIAQQKLWEAKFKCDPQIAPTMLMQ